MKKLGSESLNRNVSVINEISNDNNDNLRIVYKMSELEVYVCDEKPDIY